jgi:translation initiation factor 6 (eIF-6)
MSEYRENQDNFVEDTVTEEQPPVEEAPTEVDAETDFNPSSPDLKENQIDEDIVTAVLLIKNRQGAVLPVTNLDSLKMDRQANAHEVLRMCADVQDQIGAIRIVGELAQIFQHLNQSSLKSIADLMNVKMNQNVTGTTNSDS